MLQAKKTEAQKEVTDLLIQICFAVVIHRASEPGQSSNDEVHANTHAACDPLRLESPTQLCFSKVILF